MNAVLELFHQIFFELMFIPLFDTGVTFGEFLIALMLFDVGLIILRFVLRNDDKPAGSGTQIMKRR